MIDRLKEEEMELALYKAMEKFLNDYLPDGYCWVGDDTAMQMRNAAMSVLYAVKEVQDYLKATDEQPL